ncbi:dynamin family protein [Ruegeria lacuscaerulensis]|uniref:dynamin family protein n=1 Tax=Ruegeria lacuscaerulensis TaxID=55218 RepID=UPI00147A8283|nr:dynamin family protein [Ruegeria lacuscaerulensis]
MAKDSQTRFVSSKAWERVEQWSRRKPIFALMGEFSAGKSTLMNFLLRSHTLPTQVTATQLPPVWFSWGDQSAYVQRDDGSRDDITLDQLETVGVNDAQFIRIFLEADILEAVDLIDTPGISDPKISDDVWRRAVGQANGVLWCTHATQAWRETERATWVALPERLQNNSLLLVTRADVLGPKDRQKVLRRVNREAGHLFNRSILFSARDAITARDKSGDAELWARSGGGKMVDSFLEITEQIMDHRADLLARYQIDDSLSPMALHDRVDEIQQDQSSPLQLVNPEVDPFELDRDEVVTSFPVRPARVELRADDSERAPRIEPDEADRLRAEMTTSTVDAAPIADTQEEEDDLRAFFRESPSPTLNLTDAPLNTSDEDEYDLLDEEDFEDEDLVAEVAAENAEQDEDVSDTFMVSLEDKLSATPEQTENTREVAEETPAETSVSSITALMAEQAKHSEEFEPEPETSGLIDMQVVSLPNGSEPPVHKERLEDVLNAPAGSPLSAAAMWREISEDEELPQDAEGLKKKFMSFLDEYDQIAAEHFARGTKSTVTPLPEANKNGGAEWHVL